MSDMNKCRCLICDTVGNWENVDEHIHKPQGTYVCKTCGFVTYDSVLKKEEMKEHYRSKNNEYRAAPTVTNEFQQERKLNYHSAFLTPLFKKWKEEKRNPVVFESGAAYGRFLNWVRGVFPEGEFYGTELTLTMRRVAWHNFNLKLDEEFDDTKKYDFIASYKVAEHIPDVDKELRKYAECLKDDDSILYIGVPQWWIQQSCFGTPNWSIQEYYHPNHINMWTRKLFETLLKKSGLEIVESNHIFYDSVYLCKRNDDLMKEKPEYEDYKDIIEKMKVYKKANELFEAGKFKEAIEVNPKFPNAFTNHYEMNRAEFHKEGWETLEKYLKFAIDSCPDYAPVYIFAASICLRYKKYDLGQKLLIKALEMRPQDGVALLTLAQVFRDTGDFKESAKVCSLIEQTSSQQKNEATTWKLHDIAQIPMEWE
jgi:tetratricopeptide (TPR) repeat protein